MNLVSTAEGVAQARAYTYALRYLRYALRACAALTCAKAALRLRYAALNHAGAACAKACAKPALAQFALVQRARAPAGGFPAPSRAPAEGISAPIPTGFVV
jgi:hypothetical protein